MFQRKTRRFRRRSNGRSHSQHRSGDLQSRLGPNSFSNGETRNNLRTTLSAERLFEKYSSLAKEAMSLGDKTLSENYLQHADHFMRIVEDRNRNQNQSKTKVVEKSAADEKHLSENNLIDQDPTIKNKE